jgi:photosystem II stability/assembly factor-like uncharacterized protein
VTLYVYLWENRDRMSLLSCLKAIQPDSLKAGVTAVFFACLVTGSLAQTFSAPFSQGDSSGVSGGLSNAEVIAIAIDPRNHNTVYAGDDHGGVFKSTNGGESWVASSSGLPRRKIRALAINPSEPNIVYAATGGGGLYKTIDAASSWMRADSGFKSAQVYSIVIDPSNPETLYVGTFEGAVFKSTNGGASWTLLNLGIGNTWIWALVIDQENPLIVYAATGGDNHHVRTYGVFKTSDGGQTWKPINSGLPVKEWIFSMAVDSSDPDTILIGTDSHTGLYKTPDGGQHWSPVELRPSPYPSAIYTLAIDPTNSSNIYAGYGYLSNGTGGIAISRDGGLSWNMPSSGFENVQVFALAIDPVEPSTIYAGAANGVFKSTDRGENWHAMTIGVVSTRVNGIVVNASDSAVIYAGTNSGGILKSNDRGDTWRAASVGIQTPRICSLAVDPSDGSVLYAGTDGTYPAKVYTSSDGGESWEGLASGIPVWDVCALSIDPNDSDVIYAGSNLQGLFRTRDKGNTWAKVNLPGGIYSLGIAGRSPSVIYARSDGGIFESHDGGDNWTPTVSNLEQIFLGDRRSPGPSGLAPSQWSRPFAVDPESPSVFYASTANDHGLSLELFKSLDGGKTWALLSAQLLESRVRALAVDPSDSSILYAGTDRGVFRSTDAGISWQPTELISGR